MFIFNLRFPWLLPSSLLELPSQNTRAFFEMRLRQLTTGLIRKVWIWSCDVLFYSVWHVWKCVYCFLSDFQLECVRKVQHGYFAHSTNHIVDFRQLYDWFKAKIVLLVWHAFQDFGMTYFAKQQNERISSVKFFCQRLPSRVLFMLMWSCHSSWKSPEVNNKSISDPIPRYLWSLLCLVFGITISLEHRLTVFFHMIR